MKCCVLDQRLSQDGSTSAGYQQRLGTLSHGLVLRFARNQKDQSAAVIERHIQNEDLVVRTEPGHVALLPRSDICGSDLNV